MIHNSFRRIALAQGLLPGRLLPSHAPSSDLPDADSRTTPGLSDRRATGPAAFHPQTSHSAIVPTPPSP